MTVEAVQVTKGKSDAIREFCGANAGRTKKGASVKVYTKAGTVIANDGDWIVKHGDGSFSVLTPDEFKGNYSKARV